jgi:hypothetical protein
MNRIILFFFALTVCACNLPSRKDIVNELNKANKSAPVASVAPKGWQYSYSIDRMTSDTEFAAEATSKDKLDFEFPYNGGSTATLYVIFKDHANYLGLKVSKGSFSFEDGIQNLRIRFDSEKAFTVKSGKLMDGGLNALGFYSADSLISKLKKSEKVLIEAAFYREGTRIMEFDAGKLVWRHKHVDAKAL